MREKLLPRVDRGHECTRHGHGVVAAGFGVREAGGRRGEPGQRDGVVRDDVDVRCRRAATDAHVGTAARAHLDLALAGAVVELFVKVLLAEERPGLGSEADTARGGGRTVNRLDAHGVPARGRGYDVPSVEYRVRYRREGEQSTTHRIE